MVFLYFFKQLNAEVSDFEGCPECTKVHNGHRQSPSWHCLFQVFGDTLVQQPKTSGVNALRVHYN